MKVTLATLAIWLIILRIGGISSAKEEVSDSGRIKLHTKFRISKGSVSKRLSRKFQTLTK